MSLDLKKLVLDQKIISPKKGGPSCSVSHETQLSTHFVRKNIVHRM